jgi:hypothetical protein
MNRRNDGAVGERERPFLEGLDRYIVAELSAQLLAHAGEMELLHGDQLPIAVSGGDLDAIEEKAGSQAPVEPCERVGKHERHDEDARPEDERVLGLAQIKAAHTTDKQVADGKVEEAP